MLSYTGTTAMIQRVFEKQSEPHDVGITKLVLQNWYYKKRLHARVGVAHSGVDIR